MKINNNAATAHNKPAHWQNHLVVDVATVQSSVPQCSLYASPSIESFHSLYTASNKHYAVFMQYSNNYRSRVLNN